MLFKSAFISPKRLTERFFIFYRKFVSFFFSVGVILKRKNGTIKVKNEYHYWIDWLKKQLKNYNKLNIQDKEIINNLIKKSKFLSKDLEKFIS